MSGNGGTKYPTFLYDFHMKIEKNSTAHNFRINGQRIFIFYNTLKYITTSFSKKHFSVAVAFANQEIEINFQVEMLNI